MNAALTEQNVFSYLQANWTTTRIAWPGQVLQETGGAYVAVTIVVSRSEQPALGRDLSNNSRDTGEIVCALFSPQNESGTATAQALCRLLSQKRLGTTITFSGRVASGATYSRGALLGYNIFIPYQTQGGS